MSIAPWILPSGRVAFHHAPKSLSLKRKQSPKSEQSNTVSLADLCKESTPLKCQLNPLLFNGHLQTAWTAVKSDDVRVFYKRWRFEAQNPSYSGTFEVDFVVDPYEVTTPDRDSANTQATAAETQELPERTTFFTEQEFAALPSEDTKPMLIMLHGLSGGSHELYLRQVVKPLKEKGWEACVVNFRGCAQSKVTSPILYNARATWDVRQMVHWAREKFPHRPLFGIGFSLGANILTNYLGEEGDQCVLKAAVVCSNPWNLDISSQMLQRTWLGQEVYLRVMGTSMRSLFERHMEVVKNHPRVNAERILKTKYLYEFDRELQAPVWGYPTEGAYYRDASSIDSINAIRTPFFVINAEDDPISPKEALPYFEIQQTPYGVMCTTSWGGHLSWFEVGGTRWFTKPVTSFLHKMAMEIDLEEPFKVDNDANSESDSNPDVVIVSKTEAPIPDYQPMRRKLNMPI